MQTDSTSCQKALAQSSGRYGQDSDPYGFRVRQWCRRHMLRRSPYGACPPIVNSHSVFIHGSTVSLT